MALLMKCSRAHMPQARPSARQPPALAVGMQALRTGSSADRNKKCSWELG